MTDVINNVKNFVKKHWLAIWLVVVIVLLAFSFSYAAYTNLGSVKRVVSVKGGAGIMFSSNYLNQYETSVSDFGIKNISISPTADISTFEIDICNYAQSDPSRYNENDITYTLSLALQNSDGSDNDGASYTNLAVTLNDVNQSGFTNGKFSVGSTLQGKKKSTDKYVITVPKEFSSNGVRILATAKPDENSSSYAGGKQLGRILTFAKYTETKTGWYGEFLEKTADNYDGFNYVLKGQGEGEVILEWNPAKFEISKVFLENNSDLAVADSTKTKGWKSITLTVNSDKQNRYDIQFYKTGAGDYRDFADYVKYTYTKKTGTV